MELAPATQGQPGDSTVVPLQIAGTKLVAGVWRSARLILSVPGGSGAPASAVATSAWTFLEVRTSQTLWEMCGCPGVPRGEVAQARCAPAV